MKKIAFIAIATLLLVACKQAETVKDTKVDSTTVVVDSTVVDTTNVDIDTSEVSEENR
jgi:uncharacterized protein YcfL